MTASDTLVCDTARLAPWRNNPDYDYARGLMDADEGFLARLRRWLIQQFDAWFEWTFTDEQMNWVFVGFALLCILLVLWFVWKKHPGLFSRVGTVNRSAEELGEDTIYGIDFVSEMERAVGRNDYYTAVRYTYLYTLKQLHEAERIHWQPYKTPTEYVYEWQAEDSLSDFRRLTNGFLRVRYGNYRPDRAFYEEMHRLSETLCRLPEKGGEA